MTILTAVRSFIQRNPRKIGVHLLLALFISGCTPIQPLPQKEAAPMAQSNQSNVVANRTDSTQAESSETEISEAETSEAESLVKVYEDPKWGSLLTDEYGMTLYIFDKDEPNQTNCYGECATAWPPFTIEDENVQLEVEGIDATFGTIVREDGEIQVTANGMPLYYFFRDTVANQINGQAYSDVWWMVDPAGKKISR